MGAYPRRGGEAFKLFKVLACELIRGGPIRGFTVKSTCNSVISEFNYESGGTLHFRVPLKKHSSKRLVTSGLQFLSTLP